jgi:hypothetical protein
MGGCEKLPTQIKDDDICFLCRYWNFDLHTHALVEHFLSNIGSHAFEDHTDDRSQAFVLTDRATCHWHTLNQSAVCKEIKELPRMSIKIPGKKSIQ